MNTENQVKETIRNFGYDSVKEVIAKVRSLGIPETDFTDGDVAELFNVYWEKYDDDERRAVES